MRCVTIYRERNGGNLQKTKPVRDAGRTEACGTGGGLRMEETHLEDGHEKVGFALSDQDVANLSGYAITELNFLGNNNMIMNLDGPASYFGSWEVNGTSFSWSLNNSNKLIDAKASGNISFPSNGQALLVANAVVNAGNEKYIGTIEFTLNTVK